MKKTLKILMAIILFAVVLMLATSVNAATEVKVSELAAKETLDAGVAKDGKNLTITTGTGKYESTDDLIVDEDVFISGGFTGKITVESGKILTLADTAAAAYADITNNGKVVVEDKATITKLVNNGVAELVARPTTTLVMKEGSVIKTLKANKILYTANDFMTDTVAKKYAGAAWEDATSAYIIPLSDITFEAYAADRAGDKIEIATAGQAHDLVLKATYTYEGKKVELNVTPTWALTDADKDTTDLSVAGTAVTVQTARVGTEVKLKATVNDEDMEFVIFETKSQGGNQGDDNQGDNNQGDNNQGDANQGDNNQGDANQGEENKNEENKNDLDDTPKTGDHIIPATALLAVVVVANVVYFAKAKRN